MKLYLNLLLSLFLVSYTFNSSNAENRPNILIDFAAETNDLLTNARLKLKNKGCDWIIANSVNAESHNMGGEENEVIIIKKNDGIVNPTTTIRFIFSLGFVTFFKCQLFLAFRVLLPR